MESDDDKHQRYASIPIPTYDEATSSRPSSSQHHRGPGEISDDAERQGLLGIGTPYAPPTAESPRSSEDSDLHLPEVTGDGDEDRRRVEEFDYLDPSQPDPDQRQPRLYHRARLRSKFLSSIGATLSSIRMPSFRSLYSPVQSGDPSLPSDPPPPPPQSRFARFRAHLPSIRPIPKQYRMSAATAARLCALLTIGILVFVFFSFDIFPGSGRYLGARFDPESVRMYVQDNVDAGRIEEYLTHITSYDHVAGTEGDLYMAEWMKEKWNKEGMLDQVGLQSYYVYLNYPTADGRSVSIVKPESKKWTATLEEERMNPNKQQTWAWHGHSKSGEVEGHLVYANGGSREDFQWLQKQGIVLNGSIALMRYYGTQGDRALKIKAAEEAGCVGALIYSDPSDDGSVKGAVWPDGPWRPEDSIQRGGVSLMSWVAGDPLTPGYASTLDAKTASREENPGLVQIPSLPLSWRDARVLLVSLHDQGKPVPDAWVGGDKGSSKTWFSGNNAEGAPVVHLKNLNDENDKQQIWNLHGLLKGIEQPEKKIIVGNHRDSWCFGSVDPGSGSAVLMEMVNIFGQLRSLGWRPLRSIEFVSWDAEEYNLVGSTEYVEDNMDALRKDAVAYLNVDVGVYGPNPVFRAAGSPMWNRALLHVIDRVGAPGQNMSLRQIWDDGRSKLEGLGSGSDYVAFQDMAGTSSVDFGFMGAEHGFPYHSCYESLEWMKKFGDPDMSWHRALAQVWALLILEVADRPILPYDLRAYAEAVRGPYIDELQAYADSQFNKLGGSQRRDGGPTDLAATGFDLAPLIKAADHFTDAANNLIHFEDIWTSHVLGAGGLESSAYLRARVQYNNVLTEFETNLLDLPGKKKKRNANEERDDEKEQEDAELGHGIPGREQFKHVLFGPQRWSGYDEGFFPAVRDALDRGEWVEAGRWVERAAEVLDRAVGQLILR